MSADAKPVIWRPVDLSPPPADGQSLLIAHDEPGEPGSIDRGYYNDGFWHRGDGKVLYATAWADLPTVDTGIYVAAVAIKKLLDISFEGGLLHLIVSDACAEDSYLDYCQAEVTRARAAGGVYIPSNDFRYPWKYGYPMAELDACQVCLDAMRPLSEDDRCLAIDEAEDITCKERGDKS